MASIDSVKLPDGNEYSINEKLSSFTNGNLVEADANGNLKDSGIAKSTIGDKQNKTLDVPISVEGVSQTTVETALSAINTSLGRRAYKRGIGLEETTNTAQYEHLTGTYFLKSGYLCEALGDIQVGDTLTQNTNYKVTDVSAELASIKSAKQDKNLSSSIESQSTVEGALGALSSNKQPKTLSSAITVDGTSQTTVEGALGAINTLAASNKTDKQPKTLSSAITIEGTSQSTVEGALSGLNGYADNISDVIGKNGAVNLLNNICTSQSYHGMTITVYKGVMSFSGIASEETNLYVLDNDTTIESGQLRIVGCPTGGGSTYYIAVLGNSKNSWISEDDGAGAVFNYNKSTHVNLSVYIHIASGTDMTGKVFKPMIALASQPNVSYNTFVPYAMTNRELTEKDTEIWKGLTLSPPSYLSFEAGSYIHYRKLNANTLAVALELSVESSATIKGGQENVIATLPDGYRPLKYDRQMLIGASGYSIGTSKAVQLVVKNTGDITLYSGSDITGGVAYWASFILEMA